MSRPMIIVLAVFAGFCSVAQAMTHERAFRSVLVIEADRPELPAYVEFNGAFSAALRETSEQPVQVFLENLDLAGFNREAYLREMEDWLAIKYRDRHLDAVVPVGEPTVAPVVVTPSAARFSPSASSSVSRLPNPFCKVRATPSGSRHSVNWRAARDVCHDLTNTNACRLPAQSSGLAVAWTGYVSSVPSASASSKPLASNAANPSFQVPSMVTSACCDKRAANRLAMAPVPTIRMRSWVMIAVSSTIGYISSLAWDWDRYRVCFLIPDP